MSQSQLTNTNLRQCLEEWVRFIDTCLSLPQNSPERNNALRIFCTSFVPADVRDSPDDFNYFLDTMCSDIEFLTATRREVHQCATGNRVESVKGNQINKAVFTLLPLEQLAEGEGGSLDIVREITFISADGGKIWTAEG